MNAPNVEERLTAAAFTILTDENRHSHDAQRWAVRYLRIASHGRSTAFQRKVGLYAGSHRPTDTARVRAFAAEATP